MKHPNDYTGVYLSLLADPHTLTQVAYGLNESVRRLWRGIEADCEAMASRGTGTETERAEEVLETIERCIWQIRQTLKARDEVVARITANNSPPPEPVEAP
jgi:hypothetical protein